MAAAYRPGMRHHGGRLFVAHIDESHPVVEKTVINTVDVSAGKRKDRTDVFDFF
jgi:hypothetical protein